MRSYFAYVTLRFGLAFVFASSGIAAFLSPQDLIIYIPSFITKFMEPRMVVMIFAVYQMILPLVLIFRKNVTWPALLCAVTLAFVAISNWGHYDIFFRDMGLSLSALALMFLGKVRS